MDGTTEKKALTKAQEDFVWQFVCSHMSPDDRGPDEVIEQDYAGDKSRYLQVIAGWHGIEFCDACGRPRQECLGLQKNIEGKNVNLCGECAVEYQVEWRPKNSPIELDVLRFVRQKKYGYPF